MQATIHFEISIVVTYDNDASFDGLLQQMTANGDAHTQHFISLYDVEILLKKYIIVI